MLSIIESLKNNPDVLRIEEIEAPERWAEKVILCNLRYRNDDVEVEGFAAFPKELTAPAPVIIFNRGGNRNFAALKGERLCIFAANGYVTFGSQYRGNCGGTGMEEFGGKDVTDVIKLIDIAMELPQTRHEGVYMWGHSRGGMMTYRACAMDSRIKAAVVGAGLADCFIMYHRCYNDEYDMRQDCNELVGGSPEEMPEAYELRSAVCWPEKILCPILICQGTDDWRVIPGQSYEMVRGLKKAGKEHKFVVYPGADHSLQGTDFHKDGFAWLDAHPL
ncbi:MAG: S9 family peptidase [Firmicutes bacterium]|nr:S9 family peptidase [Bacillota bacterium]